MHRKVPSLPSLRAPGGSRVQSTTIPKPIYVYGTNSSSHVLFSFARAQGPYHDVSTYIEKMRNAIFKVQVSVERTTAGYACVFPGRKLRRSLVSKIDAFTLDVPRQLD